MSNTTTGRVTGSTPYAFGDLYGGDGWIGGTKPPDFQPGHPDGRTYVNGELKPMDVRIFDADSGTLLGSTRSDAAGEWRYYGCNPNGRYQVLFKNDEYRDENGELYNSFVQDWIGGIPNEQEPASLSYGIRTVYNRWYPRVYDTIQPFGFSKKVDVSSLVAPAGFSVDTPDTLISISAKHLTTQPGQFQLSFTASDGEDTADYTSTIALENQPVYADPTLVMWLQPTSLDATQTMLRDNGGNSNVRTYTRNPNTTGAYITSDNPLDPAFPFSFMGGPEVQDIRIIPVGGASAADGTKPRTVECWAYLKELPEAGKRAIIWYTSSGSVWSNNAASQYLVVESDGSLTMIHYWSATITEAVTDRIEVPIPNFTVTLNTWFHVHFQVDATAEKWAEIYVDGQFVHQFKFRLLGSYAVQSPLASSSVSGIQFFSKPSNGIPADDYVWLRGQIAKFICTQSYSNQSTNFVPVAKSSPFKYPVATRYIFPMLGTRADREIVGGTQLTKVGTGITVTAAGTSFASGSYMWMPSPWSTSSLMLEGWFQPANVTTKQTIVAQQVGNVTSGVHRRVGINAGKLVVRFGRNTTDANVQQYTSTANLVVNKWTHFAVAYDLVLSEMRVYIDGVLDGTLTWTWNYITASTNVNDRFVIGSGGDPTTQANQTTAYPFTGTVKGIRYMNGTPWYYANFTPDPNPLNMDQIPSMWLT